MERALYRGKRQDNGEWVAGQLIADHLIVRYVDIVESWTPLSSDMKATVRCFDVNPNTVCQRTPVLDENNRWIFENYIVTVSNLEVGCPVPDGFTGVVTFMEGCWYVDNGKEAHLLWDEIYGWTILGNIHDNPELLK